MLSDTPAFIFDERRLAGLAATGLMDSPTEESFDRIARLTARLLGVPVATITLVDGKRQFMKACVGIPEPFATTRQTPLSHSFCQHVVASESLLAVQDARLDPVLKSNLAIRDLNVIAYLGAPLKTADGLTLGSLCAIDSVPQIWTAEQKDVITDLAAFVSTEIEARRAREALKTAKQLKLEKDTLELRVKQRTEQLDGEKQFVEAVLHNVNDGIVACDCGGTITFTNAAMFRMLGVEEPAGGMTAEWSAENLTVYHPETLEPVSKPDRPLYRAARGHVVEPMELLVKHKTAGSRYMVVSAQTMRNHAGTIIGAVCGCHDITALRRSQQQLVLARQNADTANKAKSDFLANMSHEIRTPITAIMGFSELQQQDDITPEQAREFGKAVQRNATHLLNLVNDILDLTKIEAGEMTVEAIECSVSTLLNDLSTMLAGRAEERGLDLKLTVDPSISEAICTDPLRLRQIVMNLVSNAIKFTERGSIHVSARRIGQQLSISVRDTGIGMSEGQLQKIFRPFTQSDETMSRRFGGSGLGLTISRKLAQLLGGDIAVRSIPGVGSEFTLSIKIQEYHQLLEGAKILASVCPASTDQAQAAVAKVRLSGRVLVVEDGRDNQRLLNAVLTAAGAKVTIAENGLRALECLQKVRFNLVLMDLQMPEMDGYAAVAELRRRGYTLPVLALTAHATTEVRAHCIAIGFTDFLAKPFHIAALKKTVSQYLNAASPPQDSDLAVDTDRTAQLVTKKLTSTVQEVPELADVVADYIRSLPEDVDRLQDLLARRDLKELGRLVHQMKGAGGSYGFDPITDAAGGAEDAIKTQASLETIQSQVAALIAVLRSVDGFGDPRPVKAQVSLSERQ